MGLTYRQTKGSALTISEIDGNFAYFTGSHAITGSLTVSESIQTTGSISVLGSIQTTGSLTVSGSIRTTGSLTVSGSIQTTGSILVSGSGLSPITLFNVPEYISNAAALTAGLTSGMIFRNQNSLMIVTGSI
jgi:hypothetical protein